MTQKMLMIAINGCFFGTQSAEVRKAIIFVHNNCLTYLIQFYNKERKKERKDKIPFKIVHTDNCAPQ